MNNLKSITSNESLYSHFDVLFPMQGEYLVLVLKKNFNPAIKTPFVAGGPGGVYSINGKENGEGKVNFNPQNKKSFINTVSKKIEAGLDSYSIISDQQTNEALAELSFDATKGDQRIGNGVKEVVEETGLVAVNVLDFVERQVNNYGEQNFFITNKFFTYDPKIQEFDIVKNLLDVSNFICTDADIAQVRVVKFDEVFNSKEFTVIGSHKRPLQKAITFYKNYLLKSE